MQQYVIQRIGLSVLLVWFVATVLFFFIHLLPGDPAEVILGSSETSQPSAEQIAAVRQRLGLDRPLHEQYLNYLAGIVQGDLGDSFLTGRPVILDIRLRFGRTLMLVVPAMVLSSLLGIGIGVLAAHFRGKSADILLSSFGLLGHSLPAFVTGSLFVLFLSIRLGLFPSSGFIEFSRNPTRFLAYLALPVLTLTAGRMAATMRMTRMAMVEQFTKDYVRTARAKGLPERLVVYRHVLRNAILPVVTVIGLQTGRMFSSVIIVEVLFNWPGLNNMLIKAMANRDYPLVLGAVLFTSTVFVFINLITDLSYALLDPRIQYD
jgi:peptide/nickel transport system permease protein